MERDQRNNCQTIPYNIANNQTNEDMARSTVSCRQHTAGEKDKIKQKYDLLKIEHLQKVYIKLFTDMDMISTESFERNILQVIHETLSAKLNLKDEISARSILLSLYRNVAYIKGREIPEKTLITLGYMGINTLQNEVEIEIRDLVKGYINKDIILNCDVGSEVSTDKEGLEFDSFAAAFNDYYDSPNIPCIEEAIAGETAAAKIVCECIRKKSSKIEILYSVLVAAAVIIAAVVTAVLFVAAVDGLLATSPALPVVAFAENTSKLLGFSLDRFASYIKAACVTVGLYIGGTAAINLFEKHEEKTNEREQKNKQLAALDVTHFMVSDLVLLSALDDIIVQGRGSNNVECGSLQRIENEEENAPTEADDEEGDFNNIQNDNCFVKI